MRKKLFWIILALVIVIIALVALKKSGAIGKDEGIKVATEKVEKRTIIETVNASGKIYPEIEVKVSPDVSGEITDLNVEEGDSVTRGDVLARIYADIYTSQRDQASALVNQQTALVDNTRAQMESLKSALDLAQKTYDRQKQLVEQKVISRAEFEQAENALHTAQANFNAALQGIKSGQASVASARANLERANKDLTRTVVTAPMSGVISLLNVKKGERVVGNSMMAGTEMMRIADMSKIEVRVDVGENDIPKVHLGDSALVEVDAYNNRKFRGVVTQIASSSVTAAASSGSVSNNDVTNYKVYIRLVPQSYSDLINPKRPKSFPFRPGMTASADIQTKIRKDVVSVAINAVTTREKGTNKVVKDNTEKKPDEGLQEDTKSSLTSDLDEVVFVLQPDKTVKKVKVKTDVQDINYIEVTEGLSPGQEIITAPYSVVSKTLKDGAKVQVVPKDKLFEAPQ